MGAGPKQNPHTQKRGLNSKIQEAQPSARSAAPKRQREGPRTETPSPPHDATRQEQGRWSRRDGDPGRPAWRRSWHDWAAARWDSGGGWATMAAGAAWGWPSAADLEFPTSVLLRRHADAWGGDPGLGGGGHLLRRRWSA